MGEYAEEHPEVHEDYEAPLSCADDGRRVRLLCPRQCNQRVAGDRRRERSKGNTFWLDQQNISGGEGWAGEIVRAIKAAKGVLVMCSKAAFESDHVKREIYLADRYRKETRPRVHRTSRTARRLRVLLRGRSDSPTSSRRPKPSVQKPSCGPLEPRHDPRTRSGSCSMSHPKASPSSR